MASTDSSSSTGSGTSKTNFVFNESPHKPTSGITAEMTLSRTGEV